MGFWENAYQELEYEKRIADSICRKEQPETMVGLYCKTRMSGQKQFYIRERGTGVYHYVNKDQLPMMAELVRSRFDKERSDILKKNIELLEILLADYRNPDADCVLAGLPAVYRQARDYLDHYSDGRKHVSSKAVDKADERKHITTFGLAVRSKGEALIAEALNAAGVSFQYEKKLVLADEKGKPVEIHPDFTIRAGRTQTLYWEHKGMLTDPDYVDMDNRKMDLYYRNRIYPPVNLIVSCDGPDGSLDMSQVHQMIRGVILPLVKPVGRRS